MQSDLDSDFTLYLTDIFAFAGNHPENNLLDQWTSKLLSVSGESPQMCGIRNEYASLLLSMLRQNRPLGHPFNRPPPESDLPDLSNMSPNANRPGTSQAYSPGKFSPRPGTPRTETTFNVSEGSYTTHSHLISDSGHSIVIEDLHVSVPNEQISEEQNELCDEVERIARSMNVFEFVAAISPHLEDKGDGLNMFMSEELNQFRAFVVDMFDSKNQYYGDMMARHQTLAKKQYNKWIRRLEYFFKDNQNFLATYAPDYDLDEFNKNPNYFDEYFARQLAADGGETYQDEGDSQRWRTKNFHKLLMLRNETKGVQERNEDLRKKLDALQRKFHDDQTIITMHEQIKHEKSASLQDQLREERNKKNKYDDKITALLERMGIRKAN